MQAKAKELKYSCYLKTPVHNSLALESSICRLQNIDPKFSAFDILALPLPNYTQ